MPPIPCSRKNLLFWAESFVLEKCPLSLAMTAVRPVNRLLGFGIRGMTPSDVILLRSFMLCMCICQRSMTSACFGGYLISSCFAHRISCIEHTAANNNVMSIWKNVCSAHSEWSKMSVRGRERKGSARASGDAGTE